MTEITTPFLRNEDFFIQLARKFSLYGNWQLVTEFARDATSP
jgi:hypothetical protein